MLEFGFGLGIIIDQLFSSRYPAPLTTAYFFRQPKFCDDNPHSFVEARAYFALVLSLVNTPKASKCRSLPRSLEDLLSLHHFTAYV